MSGTGMTQEMEALAFEGSQGVELTDEEAEESARAYDEAQAAKAAAEGAAKTAARAAARGNVVKQEKGETAEGTEKKADAANTQDAKIYVDSKPCKKKEGCSRMSSVLFLAMLEWTRADSTGTEVCFDAASWARSFKYTQGFRVFSQGYQDSVLASLFHHEHLGTKKRTFVEFGFHVADVDGTANFSSVRGRHPALRELPSYGANSE